MIVIVLIAIAAGCASALMFASIISGALISLLLFYLAPLPLMVAAIGWGPLSAIIGGIGAAIGLGAIFGLPYCIAFVIMVALPACWLGHLALLGRPVTNGISSGNGASPVAPDLEWYPVGRILLWVTGFAALTTMAALLTLGTDADTITGTLRRGLLRIIGSSDAASAGEIEQFIDALVTIAPAAAAIVAMMTLTLNLWLAAKITATSGRLHRPWPDLKSTALPPMTLVAVVRRHRALLCRRIAGDPGADRRRRPDHGLRAHRLCGAAHVDAGAEKPRALAQLHLRRRHRCSAGPLLVDRRSRSCRCRFRTTPTLPAGQAAADPRALNSTLQPHSTTHITSKENEYGSHFAGTRRQARPDGRSRPRQGRICPQFPVEARQGAARHRQTIAPSSKA